MMVLIVSTDFTWILDCQEIRSISVGLLAIFASGIHELIQMLIIGIFRIKCISLDLKLELLPLHLFFNFWCQVECPLCSDIKAVGLIVCRLKGELVIIKVLKYLHGQ